MMGWRNIEKRKREYFEILKENTNTLIFDVETTGLDKDSKIIQYAAVLLNYSDNKFTEIQRVNVYINPGEKLSEEIIALTGITDEFLSSKPYENVYVDAIIEFMHQADVWVGYNPMFDIQMVRAMGQRNNKVLNNKPIIDVLELARDFISREHVEKMSLCNITNYLIQNEFEFHNALSDVEATIICMKYLLDMLKGYETTNGNSIEHLEKASIWINPYKKEVRIKALLTGYGNGDVYYDLFSHSWKCKREKKIERMFENLDKEDLERQFLDKYAFPFEKTSVDEVGFSWLEWVKKSKERK